MIYHKWFNDDLTLYESVHTKEQIGELVLAIKDYLVTGVKPEVPPELTLAFGMQCQKVDGARAKYEAKCEVNAHNGAKGGKAKGRNYAAKLSAEGSEPEPEELKSIPPPPFKPLSKSDFIAFAQHWTPHADRSKIERLYSEAFVGSDWKLDDEFPVSSNATIITAICIVLAEIKFFGDRNEDWQAFLNVYSVLKGDVPFPLFEQFAKTYRRYHDKPGGVWSVKGAEYSDYSEAVDAFFGDG
jgi:hypothetical protein